MIRAIPVHLRRHTNLSRVVTDKLDDSLHGIFLLQQLQTRSIRVRDVAQPVFAVEIPSMEFSGQERLRGASVHWDLCSI